MRVPDKIKQAIRDKYAWPGGYPLFLITSDGGALCMKCGKKEYKNIAYAIRHDLSDGWNVIAFDINWEDGALYCAHTGARIPSAYAEPEESGT